MNTKLESLLASVTFGLLVLMILLIASNVFGQPVEAGARENNVLVAEETCIVQTIPISR